MQFYEISVCNNGEKCVFDNHERDGIGAVGNYTIIILSISAIITRRPERWTILSNGGAESVLKQSGRNGHKQSSSPPTCLAIKSRRLCPPPRTFIYDFRSIFKKKKIHNNRLDIETVVFIYVFRSLYSADSAFFFPKIPKIKRLFRRLLITETF